MRILFFPEHKIFILFSRIVRRAEEMFLHDQLMEANECNNEDFHDSAPSGKFGTMTYLVRSSTEMLEREQYSLPQSCIIQ